MREAQTRTSGPAEGATVSRTLGGRGSSVQRLLGHGEPRLVLGVGVIGWVGKGSEGPEMSGGQDLRTEVVFKGACATNKSLSHV